MSLLESLYTFYLIDKPSAYLDSKQHIVASKNIKWFLLHAKKVAFMALHVFKIATHLVDRVFYMRGSIFGLHNKFSSHIVHWNKYLALSHPDLN